MELYLQSRGVSLDVIRYCISRGRLYESLLYRSCVFVGLDPFAGAGTTILAAVQELSLIHIFLRIFEIQCSRFRTAKLPSAQIFRSRIME